MKNWVRPMALEEAFVANSNVSACYSLVCTLPGNNPYTEDGSGKSHITASKVKDRASYYEVWGQQTGYPQYIGEKHDSNCAKPARYNEATGNFYETGINGSKLSNIIIDKEHPVSTGKYPAIWTSSFLGDYHHIGFAIDDSANHPQRS